MVVWRINTKLQPRLRGKWSSFQQFFLVLDRWHTEELKDWIPAVCMITDQTHSTVIKNNLVRSSRRSTSAAVSLGLQLRVEAKSHQGNQVVVGTASVSVINSHWPWCVLISDSVMWEDMIEVEQNARR